jgi:histone H4
LTQQLNNYHIKQLKMSSRGRGLGAAGIGAGGIRRHQKVYRDNIQGVTKNAIKRLARRGGCKRISAAMYDHVRGELKTFLQLLVKDSVVYTEHARRKTVSSLDVVYALKRQGRSIYGFGTPSMGSGAQPRSTKKRLQSPVEPVEPVEHEQEEGELPEDEALEEESAAELEEEEEALEEEEEEEAEAEKEVIDLQEEQEPASEVEDEEEPVEPALDLKLPTANLLEKAQKLAYSSDDILWNKQFIDLDIEEKTTVLNRKANPVELSSQDIKTLIRQFG